MKHQLKKKQLQNKLGLDKTTVQHLDMEILEREDRKAVRGGDDVEPPIITMTPVYC